MMRRRQNGPPVAGWVAWILVCDVLAGWRWPDRTGLVFMGLALFGVLHLAVLVYEEIAEPQYREDMSPEEFEHYCAAVLRRAKWRAFVTQASGDQGVDIVAEKRGLRIVLQCKKYAKPVGNRAVQEIAAGVAFAQARRGVVVTTSGYTPAAEALAESNGVLLLHHSELSRIDRHLRTNS